MADFPDLPRGSRRARATGRRAPGHASVASGRRQAARAAFASSSERLQSSPITHGAIPRCKSQGFFLRLPASALLATTAFPFNPFSPLLPTPVTLLPRIQLSRRLCIINSPICPQWRMLPSFEPPFSVLGFRPASQAPPSSTASCRDPPLSRRYTAPFCSSRYLSLPLVHTTVQSHNAPLSGPSRCSAAAGSG